MNIAEILKDAPEGTKLYSPLFGECELVEILDESKYPIRILTSDNDVNSFTKDGKFYNNEYYNGTECLLFPSKENRNWNKFLIISPGDVIVSPHDVFYLMRDNNTIIFTYDINNNLGGYGVKDLITDNYRKATGREVKRMFDFIKQKGFKYNPTDISIEKIKKEYQFEPFDKVIVRDNANESWTIDIFREYCPDADGVDPYYECFYDNWRQCIPYNEQTKRLVGTKEAFNS